MWKNIVLCFILAAFLASTAFGQENFPPYKTTTKHTTTPPPTTTTPSTTTKPTTPPTTTKPTTPTTPSTTPPTTPPSNSTTTTPSPTPTPKPEDHIGNWTVKENNTVCILSTMQIQLNVSYIAKDNTTKHSVFYLPKNATATGTCGNLTQSLKLVWKENQLDFNFTKITNNHYEVSNIHLQLIPYQHVFPGINATSPLHLESEKSEFKIPLSMSYHCAREESISLKEQTPQVINGTHIIFSHLQMEAFRNVNTTKFSSAEDCESSGSLDIVPIAVGCALVILVVIVLFAYLVGRRRSQNRGYLSM